MKRTVILLFGAVLLAACGGQPPAKLARIVFVSNRDGNYEIYVVNADGSGLTRLTDNPAYDGFPAASPSATSSSGGARIAFNSDRDGNIEIYLMNADGSGLTRLTDDPAPDYEPTWSPDGAHLAFTSFRDGNGEIRSEIYVIDADGSNLTRLTDNPAADGNPAWSPDGRIAFQSDRDGNYEIYVINADGSGLTRLTNNSAFDGSPAWSPDARIAFQSDRDGAGEIYVMHPDGSAQTNLTNSPADDWWPTWAPDGSATWSSGGTRIAFFSRRYEPFGAARGKSALYVMNADGSRQTRLTDYIVFEQAPVWSPDASAAWSSGGGRIAFESYRDGNLEIYVVNADGSGLTRLTDNPADDAYPAWLP